MPPVAVIAIWLPATSAIAPPDGPAAPLPPPPAPPGQPERIDETVTTGFGVPPCVAGRPALAPPAPPSEPNEPPAPPPPPLPAPPVCDAAHAIVRAAGPSFSGLRVELASITSSSVIEPAATSTS